MPMNNYHKFGKNKMKVCHVIWSSGIGGTETYVLNFLKYSKNLSNNFLIHLSDPGPLWGEYSKLNIPIYSFSIKHGLDFQNFFSLFRFFKRNKFDIIHFHISPILLTILLPFIKRQKNTKIIFTEHSPYLLTKTFKKVLFYRKFATKYDKIIAISEFVKNKILEISPFLKEKVVVIYNGIPIFSKISSNKDVLKQRKKLFPHLELKPKVIGIVARLVYQKGIDRFLYIAHEILRKRNDISFLIVGDGPLKEELIKLAKKLGVFNDVYFLGFQRNVVDIIKCFDLFLFTSRYEPFGLVIIESMLAGVPVVALSCEGAVYELIEANETGFLINDENYAVIADKILNILDDLCKCESIIEKAYCEIVDKFSIENNVRRVFEVYNNLL